jgi:hypothetical protein
MGYISHHAMIVTGFNKNSLKLAHKEAELRFTREGGFCFVSPIITSPINGYLSFFIAPDGSKEGWEDSDYYDKARREYGEWLLHQVCQGNYYQWVIVQYGDDGGHTCIIADNDGGQVA